ncbi:hypothetical protein HK098_007396 [Nowakowskiella sp. JEL0407]|nr:hypothetical protein HK098_007396 [Nowakowskiella sp. JEL0407]
MKSEKNSIDIDLGDKRSSIVSNKIQPSVSGPANLVEGMSRSGQERKSDLEINADSKLAEKGSEKFTDRKKNSTEIENLITALKKIDIKSTNKPEPTNSTNIDSTLTPKRIIKRVVTRGIQTTPNKPVQSPTPEPKLENSKHDRPRTTSPIQFHTLNHRTPTAVSRIPSTSGSMLLHNYASIPLHSDLNHHDFRKLTKKSSPPKQKKKNVPKKRARSVTTPVPTRSEQNDETQTVLFSLVKSQLNELVLKNKEQTTKIASLKEALALSEQKGSKLQAEMDSLRKNTSCTVNNANEKTKQMQLDYQLRETNLVKSYKQKIRDLELAVYKKSLELESQAKILNKNQIELAELRERCKIEEGEENLSQLRSFLKEMEYLCEISLKHEQSIMESDRLKRAYTEASEKLGTTEYHLQQLFNRLKNFSK